MKLNITIKNFIYYALIIMLTATIITIIASREYKKHYLDELASELQKQAKILRAEVSRLLLQSKFIQLDNYISLLAKENDVRITIIGKDGKVIADSDYDEKLMEDHSLRPEFIQALKFGYGKQIRYSKTTKQHMLYVAIPVVNNNENIAVIRVSAYLSQINQHISMVHSKIIISAIILSIFALLLAFLTSRNLTNPIRTLTKMTERIKNGEFQTRIIVNRKDEIGRLTEAINNMAESLNNLFKQTDSEREELKSILSLMAEGLIVLDDKDKIVMTNDNFKTIVGFTQEDIKDKYYWQVINSPEFSSFIKIVKNTGVVKNQEIAMNNKTFLANGTYALKIKKTIITLHDITEAKKLERIKSDFIANVSHELKTPLTSIKGFAETLEESASKKHRQFVQAIRRNADRLINIVQDLLVISDLERPERKLEIEPINLKEMLDNIKKVFNKQIKEKKIKLLIAIEDDAQFMSGDAFLIEQMFNNLLDNAIKYNVENGKINVSISRFDNNIKIVIEDTGIGIAQEHLDRIFERFYVVDKSRSRKLGGTGLGLAIVKHIVLSHNGEIKVESEVGKGTRFIITLPQI
ncbi:MAG: cell wall metabolism sensor histidine kinase WalK [candidate division WOR-3 bacterium]|nr:cell wall metabolism sensor histidine kinase WalK [candidate division WOR-3 bacterium]